MQIWHSLLKLILLSVLCNFVFVTQAFSSAPSGYSQFYVPGDEEELWYIMDTLGGLSENNKDTEMHTAVSVAASSDNTVIYWDHWENGYGFDPDNPSTADEVITLASKGEVYTFESGSIVIPRVVSQGCADTGVGCDYDGRDMFYVTGGVPSVTRSSWPEDSTVSTLQALAWEVYPVRPQLSVYKVPFGEDLDTDKGYEDFERVFALIMATEDNTIVTIDGNNDGIPDQIDADHDGVFDEDFLILNKGETYRFDNKSLGPQSFNHNFESGAEGFTTVEDSANVTHWELGSPLARAPSDSGTCSNNCYGSGPTGCSSGSQCWGTDLDDLYINNITTSEFLYSPEYNFSGSTSVQLSYMEWLEIMGFNNEDFAGLEYSINGGTTWNLAWESSAADRLDAEWRRFTHDASSYAANQQRTQWRWRIRSDGAYQAGGWYIDDINVTASSPGISTGATIKANKTLQVQYVIGDQGARYELRGLSAFPRGLWDDEYYAPVGGPSDGNDAPVDIFLHNPHSYPLIIEWETNSSSGQYTIPAGETTSFQVSTGSYVPAESAVYLKGSDVFWGISNIDSEGTAYDWGYSLVPNILLEAEHVMSWSPGSTNLAVNKDSSGAFITAVQDNTRVYIDLDPASDSDTIISFILNRLQSKYVYDELDGKLDGARIWATGPLAIAYGQNPIGTTPGADPAIDVGYTTIPGANMIERVLTVNETVSPGMIPVDSGSQAKFTIRINSYDYAVDNIIGVNELPEGWEYVAGQTTITTADLNTINGSTAEPIVSDGKLTWPASVLGDLGPNQYITIAFTGRITTDFNLGDLSRSSVDAQGSRTVGGVTQTFNATDFCFVTYGSLLITKTTSGVDPLSPGDQYSYEVTITNPDTAAESVTGVALYDSIPPGVTYITSSAVVNGFKGEEVEASDRFATESYENNNGTANFAGNWRENDSSGNPSKGGATSGNVLITNNKLRLHGGGTAEIGRSVDLSNAKGKVSFSFDYLTTNGVDTNDSVVVEVSSDGNNYNILQNFTGFSGTSTGSQSYDITSYKSPSTSIRFKVMANYDGDNEYFYIDNVSVVFSNDTIAVTDAPASSPPGFISGDENYILEPGQSMTLKYDVVVDDPIASGIRNIISTAYASADQFPQPISASVTNIVNIAAADSGSVSGRVWFDVNDNGLEDLGETGFSNVTLQLKDQFSALVATTSSDSNGNYRFDDIAAGDDFYIEIVTGLPAGLTQTAPSGQTGGRSNDFDLVAGQVLAGTNLGFTVASSSTATLGDLIWQDVDNDGVRDAGEIGLSGVTVSLYSDSDGDGNYGSADLIATTDSNLDGSYLLSGLTVDSATDYFIVVTEPSGYTIDPAEKNIKITGLSSGAILLSYDFGLQSVDPIFTITEKVYLDADQTGTWSTGDTGLAGVTAEIMDASGFVIGSTMSDAGGNIVFTGLSGNDADYTVRINDSSGILSSYFSTSGSVVNNELLIANLSSDYSGTSFSYYLNRTIGGVIFRDLDSSGTHDNGEPGIPGVNVQLYADDGDGIFEPGTDDGSMIASVTSTTEGGYLFSGLDDGAYFITVEGGQAQLLNLTPTTDDDGSVDGAQVLHSMIGGQNKLDLNIGYRTVSGQNYSITGAIWEDIVSYNGTVDSGEPILENVTVELRDSTGNLTLQSTSTDQNGLFTFAGLQAATYRVVITDENNILTGMITVFEVTEGAENYSYDGFEDVVLPVSGGGDAVAINFGYERLDPTFAMISSFTVFEKDGRKVVEWHTSTEIRTNGFDLLRKDSNGEYIQVNSQMIPSVFITRQGIYQCIDEGMNATGENIYMIREYAAGSADNMYGPFVATLSEVSEISHESLTEDLLHLGFSSNEKQMPELQKVIAPEKQVVGRSAMVPMLAVSEVQEVVSNGPVIVKVAVEQSGVYKVDAETLAGLTGIPVEAVKSQIALGRVSLTNSGDSIRYTTNDDNSSLYFYGEERSTIYTNENVYLLQLTAGNVAGDLDADGTVGISDAIISLQILSGNASQTITSDILAASDVNGNSRIDMAEVLSIFNQLESVESNLMEITFAGSPDEEISEEQTFRELLRFEEDVTPRPDLDVPVEYDYWFWAHFNAFRTQHDFPFEVVDPSSSPESEPVLSVYFYGLSEVNSAALIINPGSDSETTIGTVEWAGVGLKRVDITLTSEMLLAGENTLRVSRTEGNGNVFALDSMQVGYKRKLNAGHGGVLLFENGQYESITVRGFADSNITVLNVSDPAQPFIVIDTFIEPDGETYSVSFNTPEYNNEYVAFISSGTLTPVSLIRDSESNLRDVDMGAQYVIITTEEFSSTAEELAAYRTASGLSSKVVLLSDIFDEFSQSVYHPLAIRSFIAYALQYWVVHPEYIVLVGDGSFDYKDNMGAGDNIIPTMMTKTPHGLFASDNIYADIDADGLPDVSIGRISVTNNDELRAAIAKIQEYETSSVNDALFIADVDDSDTGISFSSANDDFALMFSEGYDIEKVYMSQDTTPLPPFYSLESGLLKITDSINTGVRFLNYAGHGGWDSIGNASFLTNQDAIDLLNNTHFPILTAQTCLIGDFAYPGYDSFAESLTKYANGGVVASWSPSGLSVNNDAISITSSLFEAVFSQNEERLGDAVISALSAYHQNSHLPYMISIYNLLGDPALKLNTIHN